MKASTIKGLGTLIAGLLAVLAVPASAQLSTTANGPYYAWPSWDQKLTANRFVILANWNSEAVLDRETGLVWHRSLSPTVFSGFADQGCLNSATGGRAGWRLPTVSELASLIDVSLAGGSAPLLPPGHPFTGVPNGLLNLQLWTASSPNGNLAQRYTVGWTVFNSGNIFTVGVQATNTTAPYICVRGGAKGEF